MQNRRITTLLFDLGGTLHTVKRTEASRYHFCEHLLSVLSEHGVSLDVTPNALDAMLAVNGEEYKHFGEKNLIELPQSVIWSQYYLKELHIPEERLAPFAEELSFLYDHERVINSPRPYLRETMMALHAQGIRLGIVSNIISTTLVPFVLRQYGILLGSSRSPWTRCTPSRRRRATWGTLSPGTCWAPETPIWACVCASTTPPSLIETRLFRDWMRLGQTMLSGS